MKKLVTALLALFIFLAFPHHVHAIIFLPAVILIPIAKLVAIIIGGFSIPAVTLGTLWSKLFKKSTKQTILIIVGALLVIGVIMVVVFKVANPDRPLL